MSFTKVVEMLTRFERSPLNKKLGMFIRQSSASRLHTPIVYDALTTILARLRARVVDRAVLSTTKRFNVTYTS